MYCEVGSHHISIIGLWNTEEYRKLVRQKSFDSFDSIPRRSLFWPPRAYWYISIHFFLVHHGSKPIAVKSYGSGDGMDLLPCHVFDNYSNVCE